MQWSRPPPKRKNRLPWPEVLGLRPLGQRLAETRMVLRGDALVPPSRFGLSSLKVYAPRVAVPTWLGLRRADGRLPIANLFNYRQPPPEQGWSVRVTAVEDYRGRRLTYDSHNGTDFVVPPGTTVVAPAPGRVVRVSDEFHRGGLKVFIDHGGGIATSCNHLGRVFVHTGDEVARGERIALSGYSGIDGLVAFPWVAPHIHFNVFLDGRHVDPFVRAGSGEQALWRDAEPRPAPPPTTATTEVYRPSALSESGMAAAVVSCRDPLVRAELAAMESRAERYGALLFQSTYFPMRFSEPARLYEGEHERWPLLSLPVSADDYVGVWYADRV